MFEDITGAQKGKGLGSSLAVSVLLHGAVIALALVFTYVKAKMPKSEEPVAVTFRPPPPPPPPPPPAGHKPKTPRQTPKTPITPRPTRAFIQPKEVPKVEEKPPETNESADEDEGVEGGVEGGVVGGVVGGQLGGTVGGAGEGPPMLLGAGMSRPVALGNCSPTGSQPKPPTPEQARSMGVTGMVLVEYVVHADGSVGDVKLKNPTAPPILFEAVKHWLESCTYTPSMSGSRPVPVKIVQPFIFKQQ